MKPNRLLIIIFVSVIIIGSVILTNFLSFSDIEKTIMNQIREKQSIETDNAMNNIGKHIFQVRDELVTLSKFPVMDSLDINQCEGDMRIIHQSIEGKINSLLRVDKDGNIIECSAEEFSNYVGINIKNKEYFKVPKETNEPYISGLTKQGSSQQIIVSAPLFDTQEYTPYPNFEGNFEGELLSIIEVDKLYSLYIHPVVGTDKSSFLLVNAESKEIILKSETIEYSDVEFYFEMSDPKSSAFTNIDGLGESILTYSDLNLGPETWRLIVLTPLDKLDQDIVSVQNRHMFSLIFVLILIILILISFMSVYKSREQVQSKLNKAKITLENLGISIETEDEKFNRAEMVLKPGNIYLIKEDEENHAHELFINSLNKGFAGLGIVREDPRIIKEKYNLQKTSFIWLSKTEDNQIPCETNIDTLLTLITEFIKKSKKSVILIDRLDYLINQNSFEKVIDKIQTLKDLITNQESIIILSLNPDLINENQIKSLEAETIDLYGKHLRKKVELSDIEMNMLRFINERNSTNRLASYKHITEKFDITKPTTRVKINRLRSLGLVQVEQKGRFKSLKITSAGRKIID